jgi:hypothetical protein
VNIPVQLLAAVLSFTLFGIAGLLVWLIQRVNRLEKLYALLVQLLADKFGVELRAEDDTDFILLHRITPKPKGKAP